VGVRLRVFCPPRRCCEVGRCLQVALSPPPLSLFGLFLLVVIHFVVRLLWYPLLRLCVSPRRLRFPAGKIHTALPSAVPGLPEPNDKQTRGATPQSSEHQAHKALGFLLPPDLGIPFSYLVLVVLPSSKGPLVNNNNTRRPLLLLLHSLTHERPNQPSNLASNHTDHTACLPCSRADSHLSALWWLLLTLTSTSFRNRKRKRTGEVESGFHAFGSRSRSSSRRNGKRGRKKALTVSLSDRPLLWLLASGS